MCIARHLTGRPTPPFIPHLPRHGEPTIASRGGPPMSLPNHGAPGLLLFFVVVPETAHHGLQAGQARAPRQRQARRRDPWPLPQPAAVVADAGRPHPWRQPPQAGVEGVRAVSDEEDKGLCVSVCVCALPCGLGRLGGEAHKLTVRCSVTASSRARGVRTTDSYAQPGHGKRWNTSKYHEGMCMSSSPASRLHSSRPVPLSPPR